ncbi:MAG TPA: COX15/CtaA family protein [Dehalococcoidia bacterium]|nr:COX15/CtaA family protein [Dehalococcoidia bacterium]
MTGFQRLCIATTALVFVLIVIGGTVRATDSGLGCPDWPRCHGSFIPKWEKHTLIEYTHRLVASVAGLMVFAIAAWAWKSYRHVRSIWYPASATAVLLLVQGGLGGITVIQELPPEIVTVHLATALTLFALLVLITVAAVAQDLRIRLPTVGPGVVAFTVAASGLTLATMLLGAYVAGADYSLACSGWPLCNGEIVPDLSLTSVQLVFIHRLLAAALGVSLIWLAFVAARSGAELRLLATSALGVYVAQVLVGAANIWTQVADLAQIAHLGVGTALWGILAYLNIRIFGLHEALDVQRPAGAPAGDLARLAR